MKFARWQMSHTPRIWDDSFKQVEYLYLPIKDQNMVKQWLDQGYSANLTLNGAAHTLKDQIPDYIRPLCDQLAWNDIGIQLYRMAMGDIIPVHQDHYLAYMRAVGVSDRQRICRAVVFMEDWKSGHYIEIDGTAVTGWQAGDYVTWQHDVPHMAANIGIEPRYTLQITGWL